MRRVNRFVIFLVLLGLAACGTSETREARAIRTLQAALPASTRAAEGLPDGGWAVFGATDALTITLPLNTESDIEQGLRASRALLVKGVAQLFEGDTELDHLVLMGTLPYGPDRTEAPFLVGDIRRTDVATWDKTTDQLGVWRMTIPTRP